MAPDAYAVPHDPDDSAKRFVDELAAEQVAEMEQIPEIQSCLAKRDVPGRIMEKLTKVLRRSGVEEPIARQTLGGGKCSFCIVERLANTC